jgi:hypothetical protein
MEATMAYEGEILNACGMIQLDFSDAYVVAVSGDGPNICGHLLFYAPNGGGYYFHATGDPTAKGLKQAVGYPMYMNDSGFRRYLKETGKRELRRRKIELPNPSGAEIYVERLLSDHWLWAVLPHNCVAFVEEVIKAGGGTWGSYSNCPALATADGVSDRIQSFYRWMNSGIYNLYGVPQ